MIGQLGEGGKREHKKPKQEEKMRSSRIQLRGKVGKKMAE